MYNTKCIWQVCSNSRVELLIRGCLMPPPPPPHTHFPSPLLSPLFHVFKLMTRDPPPPSSKTTTLIFRRTFFWGATVLAISQPQVRTLLGRVSSLYFRSSNIWSSFCLRYGTNTWGTTHSKASVRFPQEDVKCKDYTGPCYLASSGR